MGLSMGASLEHLRSTYEGSSEDNGRNLLAALAPDAEWTEAEGFSRWNLIASARPDQSAQVMGGFPASLGGTIDFFRELERSLPNSASSGRITGNRETDDKKFVGAPC